MGCGSSKTQRNSASIKEEVHIPIKKQPSNVTADPQFITLLCNSENLAKASSGPAAAKENCEKLEKSIETINAWELLAGLGEDVEEEVSEEGSPENINSMKQCPGTGGKKTEELRQEGEGEKRLKRKGMAAEIAARKAPVLEIRRTGSLKDWLMQGGQPKHGGLEKKAASGGGGNGEENAFDPALVAQLEKAMEELTMEEEEILKMIVEKWEGNARKVS